MAQYRVSLKDSVAEHFKKLGDGDLGTGIDRAYTLSQFGSGTTGTVPKVRANARASPEDTDEKLDGRTQRAKDNKWKSFYDNVKHHQISQMRSEGRLTKNSRSWLISRELYETETEAAAEARERADWNLVPPRHPDITDEEEAAAVAVYKAAKAKRDADYDRVDAEMRAKKALTTKPGMPVQLFSLSPEQLLEIGIEATPEHWPDEQIEQFHDAQARGGYTLRDIYDAINANLEIKKRIEAFHADDKA